MVMEMNSTVHALGGLLQHERFVQRLARSLVATDDEADDLVQETWLRAIQHPPGSTPSPAGWLGTVMRNLRRDRHAKDAQREKREADQARMEATPPLQQVVERQEAQRQIVAALGEIPEAHATAIVLRFFDGLPPREIAKRLSIPVETAKKRLARGLSELREKLDETFEGGRAGWLAALPLIAGAPSGSGAGTATVATSAVAALFASTMAKLLAFLGVLAVFAFIVFRSAWSESPSLRPPTLGPENDHPVAAARSQASVAIEPRPFREVVEAAQVDGEASKPAGDRPGSAELIVTGRLLGAQGRPFVDNVFAVEVAISGGKRFMNVTRDPERDELGRFELKLVRPFDAGAPGAKRDLTFVAPPKWGLRTSSAPGARIDLSRNILGGQLDVGDVTMGAMEEGPIIAAGVVEDHLGARVKDAWVSVCSSFNGRDVSSRDQSSLRQLDWALRGISKDDGSFEIRGFAVCDMSLEAQKHGYGESVPVHAERGSNCVRLVLGPGAGIGTLEGQVLLDPGVPASLIVVAVHCGSKYGPEPSRCREDGSFLYKSDRRETVRVVLNAIGVDEPVADVPGIEVKPKEVTREPRLNPLDLRGVLKAITVSAVDASGNAVSNATAFVEPREGANSEYGVEIVDGTAKLLTTGTPVNLRIEGPEYRTKKLARVSSDTRVVLEPALRATITFDPRLPRLPKGCVARAALVRLNDTPSPDAKSRLHRYIVGGDLSFRTQSGPKSSLLNPDIMTDLSSESSATITLPGPGQFEVRLMIGDSYGGFGAGVKYETAPTVIVFDQTLPQAMSCPAPSVEALGTAIKNATR